MCFTACHWARLNRIVYGASISDAAAAGFNELRVGDADLKRLGNSPVELMGGILKEQTTELLRSWLHCARRQAY